MNFEYNNKSTDDFGLMVVSFDTIDTLESGLQREIVKGESTDHRIIPNFFGAKYSSAIEFTRTLVKKDETSFSRQEISDITRWLTGNKLPKQLVCHISDTETEIYNGFFTNIQYKTAGIGIVGIIFTFTNDSPFIRIPIEKTFTLDASKTISLNCDHDLEYDYIYPTLTLCYNSTNNNSSVVAISNLTDDNRQMPSMTLLSKLNTKIDCQKLTVSDPTGHVSYDTMGWTDIDDIYWLRLKRGENKIKIVTVYTPLIVTFSYTLLKKGGELFEY